MGIADRVQADPSSQYGRCKRCRTAFSPRSIPPLRNLPVHTSLSPPSVLQDFLTIPSMRCHRAWYDMDIHDQVHHVLLRDWTDVCRARSFIQYYALAGRDKLVRPSLALRVCHAGEVVDIKSAVYFYGRIVDDLSLCRR